MRKFLILISVLSIVPVFIQAQGCMGESSGEGVKIKGYIQPQVDFDLTDKGLQNTFLFNRARVAFFGSIPYDVTYYMSAELSPFKTGFPYMLDVFASYSRLKWAKFSIGQFKTPFSLELNTPCHKLYTINRSSVVSELASPDRDLGFMISGGSDTSFLTYALGFMNGTGILTKVENGVISKPFDVNKGKDIVGRVVIRPLVFLNIGGSFRYGTSPAMSSGVTEEDQRIRYGAEIQLKKGPFLLQAEYIMGIDKGSYSTGGGCGEPLEWHVGSKSRAGMFVQAAYKTKWNIQPVIKFENLDSDLDSEKNTDFITTYGVNYYLNEWTRIQLNYLYKAEQKLEVKNDQLLLQVQVEF
jgi:phosphate-selective porin